jgi:plastocyanin
MTLRRRTLLAVVPLLALVSCGSDDGGDDVGAKEPAASAAGSSAEVTIKTFNFGPDPITVQAGTTITFRNLDKINHSVTAGTRDDPSDEFEEGVLGEAGATYELTLDEPGTYAYFCKFHPGDGMTGEIIVR